MEWVKTCLPFFMKLNIFQDVKFIMIGMVQIGQNNTADSAKEKGL